MLGEKKCEQKIKARFQARLHTYERVQDLDSGSLWGLVGRRGRGPRIQQQAVLQDVRFSGIYDMLYCECEIIAAQPGLFIACIGMHGDEARSFELVRG